MDKAPKLKYIGIAATGTNNVDLLAAAARQIVVTNVKGYSTPIVAQHTFALLFSVLEKINWYDGYVKSGKYSDGNCFTCLEKSFYELEGKTFGIIGLGAIGTRVAELAKAYGCKVIFYSTSGHHESEDYERVGVDELLATSDIVSIHAPLNENTQGLINYENLCKMKKSAYLINVGRGPIVVEKDLARALDENIIAGAGLDVFETEPINRNNPLLQIRNKERLVMTPHIAWASNEARNRLVMEMYENLLAYQKGEARNVVS